MAKKKTTIAKPNIYPHLTVVHIKNPNRWYAFPVLGILYKIIILIPVFIESFFLGIALMFTSVVNAFYTLFNDTYWDTNYRLIVGIMKLKIKIYLFLSGLSNKYPGFELEENSDFTLSIEKPKKPSKLFAFPIFGGIIRLVLLIPFFIFQGVIQSGANIGIVASFVPVLFKGKYPESTYELAKDYARIDLSSMSYMTGLSDKYPSFDISMHHKTIKIILIILGALMLFSRFGNSPSKTYQYESKINIYSSPTSSPANQ